ncbi:MAG: TlyA family RNA methyltransferase [Candidatus Wallbacteria bacterium]|nr:TlyA family RNA methyltransferase [Candidatus Wallbacteria bacterium]
MKKRVDLLLTDLGLTRSREEAKALIMRGDVLLGDQRVDKPSHQVALEDAGRLRLKERLKYVSRGGLKLERALTEFKIEATGKTCLDVGASTGGFTDCLLQNGAAKIYAVDVGYGQLDFKLRKDPRVVLLERRNFRYLERSEVDSDLDFISADVSFISLRLLISKFLEFSLTSTELVMLVKPQFEVGKADVEKGVVRDRELHLRTLSEVTGDLRAAGFRLRGATHSPITGPKGNIEFLLHLGLSGLDSPVDFSDIIKKAWFELYDKGT